MSKECATQFRVGQQVVLKSTKERMWVKSLWPDIVFLTFRSPQSNDWICAPMTPYSREEIEVVES